jgi:hypothetical protein
VNAVDEHAAIERVLQDYFDGLHHSDTARLARVFHPRALYATASGGSLTALSMDEYFPVVDRRPSPASRGDARADRIVTIEFAGPGTAWARVECQILPKRFVDLLTLVKVDGRWQVIAKVFHFDVVSS